jgi:hypothetical protein
LVTEQNKRRHGNQQTGREGTMALERQAKRGIWIMIRHRALDRLSVAILPALLAISSAFWGAVRHGQMA